MTEILANLYGSASSAKRVAHDAGLNVDEIDFQGHAMEVWGNIWASAKASGKIPDVLLVAHSEYPEAVRVGLTSMSWSPCHIALRDKLAYIYDNQEDARRIATDLGLGFVRYDNSPRNTWHSIVRQAQLFSKLDALIPFTTGTKARLYERVTCAYCTATYETTECPKCGAPRKESA